MGAKIVELLTCFIVALFYCRITCNGLKKQFSYVSIKQLNQLFLQG